MSVDVKRSEELADFERMAWSARSPWHRRRAVARGEAARADLGRAADRRDRRLHHRRDSGRYPMVASAPMVALDENGPKSHKQTQAGSPRVCGPEEGAVAR